MKYKIKGALSHQIEFATSEDKFTALVGGYRSGKSFAIIYRYIFLSALRSRQNTKVKLLLIAPTYPLVRDILVAQFINYLELKEINFTYSKSTNIMRIHEVIPGEIWFRTGSDPQRIVGFEVTDFLIDEFDLIRSDTQIELWNRAIARTSGAQNSSGAITTTPEGFKYTYELFVKRNIGKLIQAKTTDNPYIPADYIQGLYDIYDEVLVERYCNGEFVNINGRSAYYGFNRKINVILKSKFKINPHLPVHVGVDFNVNPFSVTLGQFRQSDNKLVIFDEYSLKNSNTESFCRLHMLKYKNYINLCYPDLSGVQRKTSAGLGVTDISILKSYGFEIKGNKRLRVSDRLAITNNTLEKQKVLVTDNCTNLIRDLEQVNLTDDGKLDDRNKTLTHISDAFSYSIERLFSKELKSELKKTKNTKQTAWRK